MAYMNSYLTQREAAVHPSLVAMHWPRARHCATYTGIRTMCYHTLVASMLNTSLIYLLDWRCSVSHAVHVCTPVECSGVVNVAQHGDVRAPAATGRGFEQRSSEIYLELRS